MLAGVVVAQVAAVALLEDMDAELAVRLGVVDRNANAHAARDFLEPCVAAELRAAFRVELGIGAREFGARLEPLAVAVQRVGRSNGARPIAGRLLGERHLLLFAAPAQKY